MITDTVDAGWEVLVLEANSDVGGAVRSAEITAPGYTTDLFSAFYPLAAASPVMRGLNLGDHGLVWVHADKVLAHVLDDGRCPVLSRSMDETASSMEGFAAGDGSAWVAMFEGWQRLRDPLLDALFTPFPPVRAMARLVSRIGASGAIDFARLAALPVRRLAHEAFRGEGAALILTGNAMHADIPPDAAGSGILGWLLAMLGQDVGFPVPRGGAQNLANALASRVSAGGGQVRTNARVTEIEVTGGRAVGVRTADGHRVHARRGILADVDATSLYRDLVGLHQLPNRIAGDLDRFQWDHATIKLNWALDEPVQWKADGAQGAGTVHLGVDNDGLVDFAADLSIGRVPAHPFLLLGQMTTVDPSRSPEGTESAWAYTHVPRGLKWTKEKVEQHAELMEETVARVAVGFRDSVRARHVQSPSDLQADDANLKRRSYQRRDRRPPSAADPPPHPRHRATRDAIAGTLPG